MGFKQQILGHPCLESRDFLLQNRGLHRFAGSVRASAFSKNLQLTSVLLSFKCFMPRVL